MPHGAANSLIAAWQDAPWQQDVRRRLLAWFRNHARTLPWRSEPTLYRVWVSEIMLQQTQVATVLPYFERFISQLPDVQSLAAIPESDLMKLWEGLGYYRRVRSMQAAAKQIMSVHNGNFPTSFDELIVLPGIGRYTAGAILSIALDKRLPILEGNTQRVYSRLMGLKQSPTAPDANRLLWQFAESILPRRGCGVLNQALMELGALICTPRSPACDNCPLRTRCYAAEHTMQETIPGKLTKLKYEDRTEFAFVVTNREKSKYLVREIPSGRRWAGLWDFPRSSEQKFAAADDAANWLAIAEGVDLQAGTKQLTLKHAVTRFRITLHVYQARLVGGKSNAPHDWYFASSDELRSLPMSTTGRKIVNRLLSP